MKTLKINLLGLGLLLLFSPSVNAQKVHYDYDAAGNRILKELVHKSKDEESEPGLYRTKRLEELDSSKNAAVVFPNPVQNNQVQVHFPKPPQAHAVLLLLSMDGRPISRWDNLKQINQLHLSQLSPGMYILQLRNASQRLNRQLIKK